VRALAPWPGSFLETPAGRLAVHEASLGDSEPGDEPGILVRHGDRLALATAGGRLILDRVQLAGRRAVSGDEFLRGQPRLVRARVAEALAGAASNGSAA
jgi:methionyl-tRNA formyltransferase